MVHWLRASGLALWIGALVQASACTSECLDCGPCGFGPQSSRATPLALALTTAEETAFVSTEYQYRWGECGEESDEPVGSLHVVDREAGTSSRVDLGADRVAGFAVLPGELAMISYGALGVMPLTGSTPIAWTPLPASARAIVRAGDAAFVSLSDGTVLRHLPGGPSELVAGVAGRTSIIAAFGSVFALGDGDVVEIDPATGDVVGSRIVPCGTVGRLVAAAPQHLLIACSGAEGTVVEVLDVRTGVSERLILPAPLRLLSGHQGSPVAIVSYEDSDTEGTVAVVPPIGLPALEVDTPGWPLPAVDAVVYLRNSTAIVSENLSYRLSLTTGGVSSTSIGTYTGYVDRAIALGTSQVLAATGQYSNDELLTTRLVELDSYGHVEQTIVLDGPPPPAHD